jgi:microcystin-dependent protein
MYSFLGQITQFAFLFAPNHWMECAGQTLSISAYSALYTLLGTKFGGDGITTFCLPDMRSASLFNNNVMKYYIAVEAGIYPPRS